MITTVPSDLADTFELRRGAGHVALVRSDFGRAFDVLALLTSPEASSAAGGPSRMTVGGRGGARVVDAGDGSRIVVRPGRRGGWFGKLVQSRYFVGDRFVEELILTERLRRRGAPVPEPLAAVRRPRLIGYETWLVTRRIPKAEPAAVTLAATPAERLPGPMRAMGRAVRALHDAGGDHADLNAWNVLVTGDDDTGAGEVRAHVVDLDRGRMHPAPLGARRARANLARLVRSLRKLELAHALATWPEFERGYASGGSEPGDLAAADAPGDSAAADGAAS